MVARKKTRETPTCNRKSGKTRERTMSPSILWYTSVCKGSLWVGMQHSIGNTLQLFNTVCGCLTSLHVGAALEKQWFTIQQFCDCACVTRLFVNGSSLAQRSSNCVKPTNLVSLQQFCKYCSYSLTCKICGGWTALLLINQLATRRRTLTLSPRLTHKHEWWWDRYVRPKRNVRRNCRNGTVASRRLVDLWPPQVEKKEEMENSPEVWSRPFGARELGAKAPSPPCARAGLETLRAL